MLCVLGSLTGQGFLIRAGRSGEHGAHFCCLFQPGVLVSMLWPTVRSFEYLYPDDEK